MVHEDTSVCVSAAIMGVGGFWVAAGEKSRKNEFSRGLARNFNLSVDITASQFNPRAHFRLRTLQAVVG